MWASDACTGIRNRVLCGEIICCINDEIIGGNRFVTLSVDDLWLDLDPDFGIECVNRHFGGFCLDHSQT